MPLRLTDLSRSLPLLATMLFAAVLLTGCSGGGSGSSAGATKRSFTAGPITGFGSVIINGIRFKSSTASVANDDDEAQSETDLKLGMVAEVSRLLTTPRSLKKGAFALDSIRVAR